VTVNPVGAGGEGGQGGVALIGTDHDRSGRRWDLYADISDEGLILGGWTTADDTMIYTGEFGTAQKIFLAATE
jgi:hypothetical protein